MASLQCTDRGAGAHLQHARPCRPMVRAAPLQQRAKLISRGSSRAAAAEVAVTSSEEAAYEFSCHMAVRDYELDNYSVVNNAVYGWYLQHARHEYLAYLGVSADEVARRGDALALSELNMRYHQPLRSGDKFRATCKVVKATGARLVFAQQVFRLPSEEGGSEVLVLSAEAVVVSLDGRYRPKRLSAKLREAMVKGQPLSPEDRQRLQELL